MLSLDTSGPLILGEDVGDQKMKFLLVGAYTWLAPKESPLDEAPTVGREEEGEEENQELKMEDQEDVEEPGGDLEDVVEGEAAEEGEHQEPEEAVREGVEDQEKFEVKTFRMVTPIPSKAGDVVLQAAIDMILKLRLDGYEIFQVHSDNGGEFTSQMMKKWMRMRGYVRTYTGVADPQANGRAENAVQQVKNHIRRLLLQAGMGVEKWPLAARHADEQLRTWRKGKKQDFPPLGTKVLTKKRAWKAKEFAPTMEKVVYLAPSWENHGHWIQREDGTKIVTRFYITKVREPVTEQTWVGVLEEMPDPVETRRRLRMKSPPEARFLKMEHEAKEEREETPRLREKALKIIEEEMMALMEDPQEEMVMITMKAVAKLKKVMDATTEPEEVLQTRIVGMDEVYKKWSEWEKPIREELVSLVEDKEALKVISKKEAEEMFREAYREGGKIEVVPGKLVATIRR